MPLKDEDLAPMLSPVERLHQKAYNPGTLANGMTPGEGFIYQFPFTCEECNCAQVHQRLYGLLMCINCTATYAVTIDGGLLLMPFHLFEIECTPPPKIPLKPRRTWFERRKPKA